MTSFGHFQSTASCCLFDNGLSVQLILWVADHSVGNPFLLCAWPQNNLSIINNVQICHFAFRYPEKKYYFCPRKIDVEGFGLLATTKKMLNQHDKHTTANLPYVNCLIYKNY